MTDLIAEAQRESKQTYGHRRIRRWLLRKHKLNVN
ncbi:MAG: IS3 family transposase, partial [Clostridia bacterium]|nr:IS3 family transposase [Clostridia bacterium]MBQ8894294.1 IS3 family transposase [Clostridia bacterium]